MAACCLYVLQKRFLFLRLRLKKLILKGLKGDMPNRLQKELKAAAESARRAKRWSRLPRCLRTARHTWKRLVSCPPRHPLHHCPLGSLLGRALLTSLKLTATRREVLLPPLAPGMASGSCAHQPARLEQTPPTSSSTRGPRQLRQPQRAGTRHQQRPVVEMPPGSEALHPEARSPLQEARTIRAVRGARWARRHQTPCPPLVFTRQAGEDAW